MTLTADELLAGSKLTYDVVIPADLLPDDGSDEPAHVVLSPLTVNSLQRISRATRDNADLSMAFIIQQALVEPQLTFEQVTQLPAGIARFLVDRINAISGISTPRDELEELVQAPLARACFILAKEFGWTPEDVSSMTIGQILMFLIQARQDKASE